jgi:hydroxypyruvate isomerase
MTAGAFGGVTLGSSPLALATERSKPQRRFKLKYAPHFGQFAAHAGEDLIDQLKFMADEGFTALEDNALMKRPVALQEEIGRTLSQLGMTIMGVFVVDALAVSQGSISVERR